MAQLTIASFRTIADKLAAIANEINTDFGTADGFASPVDESDSAQAIVVLLAALTDPDPITDLLDPAENVARNLLGANARSVFLQTFAAILGNHIGGYAAYLTTNADGQGNVEQVDEQFRDALGLVDPKYVFPPATDLGDFAATGATTGTFNDGAAIDQAIYGAADIEGEVINQALGASEVTLTVTGTAFGGVAGGVTRTIVIPSASANGTKVTAAVGTHIVDVTNITIAGATSGDDIQVNAILKRTIAL